VDNVATDLIWQRRQRGAHLSADFYHPVAPSICALVGRTVAAGGAACPYCKKLWNAGHCRDFCRHLRGPNDGKASPYTHRD